MPEKGFMPMYHDVRGHSDTDEKILVKQEREKAYNQDWSNLIEKMQSIIKQS